ncbi:hypothetical protein AAFF_G00338220 [Aldrovandia affinis]|uniref:Uncharacterized protein n=1 Tax=Aldrovandia affinis TaxID=143900 RepID=A0AAD7SKY3_9TELE|nr:hypothetical protein AAFF_G00338220 [Aldrovandia affinis]
MENNAVDTDTELMESTNIYVDSIMENLPVSVSYLDNLREHLKTDNMCSAVMQMCQDGWPEYNASSHYGADPSITVGPSAAEQCCSQVEGEGEKEC